MKKAIYTILCTLTGIAAFAQQAVVSGTIRDKNTSEPLAGATVSSGAASVISHSDGRFTLSVSDSTLPIVVTMTGYKPDTIAAAAQKGRILVLMQATSGQLSDVVITGTMKAVQKTASPVPVEVYTPAFFRRNPTPSIFDALQQVNGVRPQLNCNVCNTGDIHINGLEGPYTMVLIDGMPIVSSLSSVYGLSGIPNSLVERIEVVKGPASSLYGSEAIGGLINVITKNPIKAPLLSVDVSATSWKEVNADVALKYHPFKKATALLGVNYFNFSNRVDNNHDGFTDVTLQHRISVFNKYTFQRKDDRQAAVAVRYIYEDRWGGEMNWNKQFRGGDSLYGESIYTSRVELIGQYQLPVKGKWLLWYSLNNHVQRSAYGTMLYNADQTVAFGQLTWDKTIGVHDLLVGAVLRNTWYDDNTTATLDTLTHQNAPDRTLLPGLLVQDEIVLNAKQRLLLGARWDHHPVHGHIFTPRAALKYNITPNDILRLNAGTGFRVVNLFTEDHAALTGAREVEIDTNGLKPERSYNINLNYVRKFNTGFGWINIDASVWYTYFTNRILPDYLTNPNKIGYYNLDGYAVSRGASINTEFSFTTSLKGHIGVTLQDVSTVKKNNGAKISERQLLTEKWSGTWSLSWSFPNGKWVIDYTGNLYGPMLLPLLSDLDPRNKRSPVWSIQNIQCTRKLKKNIEIYGGIKNLLNWTPAKGTPFLIARASDPFDKKVEYTNDGKVLKTPENPYALTFDPNYVYAPNQGMRGFLGLRCMLQ